jgi:hypothetical protein
MLVLSMKCPDFKCPKTLNNILIICYGGDMGRVFYPR